MFYLCALSLATLCVRAAEHCATPHDGELQSLIQTAAGRTSLDTQELVEAEAQFTHGEREHGNVGGDRMQAAQHNYAPIYAKHITELLKTGISTPTIAETGILTGTGLAMWTKLFPKSQVYGFDLNTTSYLSNREKMRELGFKDDRVVVTQMDQMAETAKNQELLRSVLRSPPSIAIDDGYHIPQAGELTFLSFKPFLNEKFVYFIEDVLVQDIDAGRWKPVSLRNRQFRMWSNKILEAFDKLQLEGGSREEPRLMRMSRVLDKCKMMQLFGAHHWLGRQVESIPPEKAALPQAPEKNCPINRKQKEGEYWICVDLFGVRFVTADSQPGQSFSRGFLFNEETLERVYCCKAKGNIVQIVVKTVDPENPQAGRVNQTITMVCPAAVDVAFCAHTVQELYYPRARQ
ncbi:unnamed protein product [Effrenium voratum]|nr:unnamed protein product [Effrenium voratum]